jgi:protoporphyrinogen/coproporphyrinogen III oxidase
MSTSGDTAIIGAGIAGVTAAHTLAKAGREPIIFERQDRVGGRVQTIKRGGFTFDIGAFIYLGSYTEAVEMMREVGLEGQMGKFPAYGAMPRDGKLHFLDLSKPVRTIGGTKYLSAASKVKLVRLLALLGRKWKDLNYHDASGVAAIDTETVSEYCRRELNEEILEYLAAVVVRGPWLHDPDYASLGLLLWTLKNFFKPYFYGLDDGMDALPKALSAGKQVKLGTPVTNVTDHGTHVEVTYVEDGTERTERFANCVITTPADDALQIYPQMAGVQRSYYESTDYVASVNTHLALSRRPENPATYIMVSRRENPDLSGCIVDHLKARGRVPADKGMITVFCRHEWCVEHLDAPDQEILDQVFRFLHPYYGDLSETLEDHEIGRWRRVVPMMRTGRFKQIDAFLRSTDPRARVQLAGDLGPIPGVNAALVSGKAAAERIAARDEREARSERPPAAPAQVRGAGIT